MIDFRLGSQIFTDFHVEMWTLAFEKAQRVHPMFQGNYTHVNTLHASRRMRFLTWIFTFPKYLQK